MILFIYNLISKLVVIPNSLICELVKDSITLYQLHMSYVKIGVKSYEQLL